MRILHSITTFLGNRYYSPAPVFLGYHFNHMPQMPFHYQAAPVQIHYNPWVQAQYTPWVPVAHQQIHHMAPQYNYAMQTGPWRPVMQEAPRKYGPMPAPAQPRDLHAGFRPIGVPEHISETSSTSGHSIGSTSSEPIQGSPYASPLRMPTPPERPVGFRPVNPVELDTETSDTDSIATEWELGSTSSSSPTVEFTHQIESQEIEGDGIGTQYLGSPSAVTDIGRAVNRTVTPMYVSRVKQGPDAQVEQIVVNAESRVMPSSRA